MSLQNITDLFQTLGIVVLTLWVASIRGELRDAESGTVTAFETFSSSALGSIPTRIQAGFFWQGVFPVPVSAGPRPFGPLTMEQHIG